MLEKNTKNEIDETSSWTLHEPTIQEFDLGDGPDDIIDEDQNFDLGDDLEESPDDEVIYDLGDSPEEQMHSYDDNEVPDLGDEAITSQQVVTDVGGTALAGSGADLPPYSELHPDSPGRGFRG